MTVVPDEGAALLQVVHSPETPQRDKIKNGRRS